MRRKRNGEGRWRRWELEAKEEKANATDRTSNTFLQVFEIRRRNFLFWVPVSYRVSIVPIFSITASILFFFLAGLLQKIHI